MPKDKNLEVKVGLFVLLGLIGLTVFIFSITDSSMFKEGKSIYTIFQFANGVKKGAPVRFAGVDEGIVQSITLFFDQNEQMTKAKVELRIKKETRIPHDSLIYINQLGLMGEKYIEIEPGKDTTRFFDEGETIIGKDPLSQSAVSDRVMEVANKLDSTILGLNKIIQDEENVKAISKTLQGLGRMTEGMNEMITNLNHGKGSMGKLFVDDALYYNLATFTAKLNNGEGTVGKLLTDEELYQNLEDLTADLKVNPWKLLYRPPQRKDKR